MDNIGYEWESGFAAGVESQAPLLAKLQARIVELERAEFVPRADFNSAKAQIARLENSHRLQAETIQKLAAKLGGEVK